MHNSLVTVGNGGNKPERAQLTILYNQGKNQYQVEQTLAPDEQMALDFGKLIRDQVPDKNGHTLPPDLTFGTYRLLDLTDDAAGGLYEGKVILDKTYGHAAYGCMICCGPEVAIMGYYPLDVTTGGWDVQEVLASNSCGGGQQNVTGDFPTWWTDNTSIATASGSKINGISAGTTNHHAQSVEMYWGYREYYQLCPKTQETTTAPTNVASLSCTSPVTRGGTVTCTASAPSGSAFSGWKFTDGSGNTVTSNSTSGSWSGVVVTSGTVSVTVTNSEASAMPTAQITVNPRNWKTGAASPMSEPNGTFYPLPVPPEPVGLDAWLGEFLVDTGNSGTFFSTFISDNGPNNGYGYYATKPTFTTSFEYEINPDLAAGSTFYAEQCGNYNATTNPSGYISGSNLSAQTNRHEWNSATQSHYAFYSNSISGADNPGNYVEARIAPPGTNQDTFDSATGTGLNGLYGGIFAAAQVEPYPVNDDASGNFLGNINYAPYNSFN